VWQRATAEGALQRAEMLDATVSTFLSTDGTAQRASIGFTSAVFAAPSRDTSLAMAGHRRPMPLLACSAPPLTAYGEACAPPSSASDDHHFTR
jgi:hypothetical protein